jgi:hypothetical protein
MNINWDVVIKISVPLFTLILGKYLDRWFGKRPKLISYLGHTSVFKLRGDNPAIIHTHAIVIRNTGRETANNVRIGHNVLPENYHLFPSVPHSIEHIEGGGAEIVIPKLVPGEQITISYLYLPPLLFSQIHAYTKSDEGFAKIINVLPTPQLSKWAVRLLWVLIFIGVVSLIYLVIEIVLWIIGL